MTRTARAVALAASAAATLLVTTTSTLEAQGAPAVAAAEPASLPDTAGLGVIVAKSRAALEGLGPLWGFGAPRLGWILTDGRHHAATVQGDGPDRLVAIPLPAQTVIANHAIEWRGRQWAMVVLPLPRDERAAIALLVHEGMHAFQPDSLPTSGRTEAGEGGDYLDGEDGRTWLFLELLALGRVLSSEGDSRIEAARDAIMFRAERDRLAMPTERARLDGLDQAEGIPEYTGFRLAGYSDAELARRFEGARSAKVSWVRGVGYWTGPAWGYALDRIAGPKWRSRARRGDRFPDLMAEVVGRGDASATLLDRAKQYGGDEIRVAEHSRAVAIRSERDSLRALFITGPVIRLIPGSLQVGFDPNGQVVLGNDGTVMRGFRWAGADSSVLEAPAGALVSPMWDWIQVPLGSESLEDGTLTAPRTMRANGWTLTIASGWRVTRTGGRLELRPPAR